MAVLPNRIVSSHSENTKLDPSFLQQITIFTLVCNFLPVMNYVKCASHLEKEEKQASILKRSGCELGLYSNRKTSKYIYNVLDVN